MAKGVALQIKNHVPGMELVAISNRTIERALKKAAPSSMSWPACVGGHAQHVDDVQPIEHGGRGRLAHLLHQLLHGGRHPSPPGQHRADRRQL